jgi:hypothetical protein
MEEKRAIPKTALFVVPLIVLVLALGIWMGHNTGKPDPSELPPPVTTAVPPETTAPTEPWHPTFCAVTKSPPTVTIISSPSPQNIPSSAPIISGSRSLP